MSTNELEDVFNSRVTKLLTAVERDRFRQTESTQIRVKKAAGNNMTPPTFGDLGKQ